MKRLQTKPPSTAPQRPLEAARLIACPTFTGTEDGMTRSRAVSLSCKQSSQDPTKPHVETPPDSFKEAPSYEGDPLTHTIPRPPPDSGSDALSLVIANARAGRGTACLEMQPGTRALVGDTRARRRDRLSRRRPPPAAQARDRRAPPLTNPQRPQRAPRRPGGFPTSPVRTRAAAASSP